MYARLVRFSFGTGKQAEAKALADDLAPLIAAQPGCKSVTVFGDHADGQYGIFVLWNTEADAESAAQVVRPKLDAHLSGNVQAPPETRLFEVISP
jgi:quinol monooxygenase YgiN